MILVPAASSFKPLVKYLTLAHVIKQLVSYQFSINSLTALAGRWITSPAAMRLTTVSSSLRITPAMFTALLIQCRSSSTAGNNCMDRKLS